MDRKPEHCWELKRASLCICSHPGRETKGHGCESCDTPLSAVGPETDTTTQGYRNRAKTYLKKKKKKWEENVMFFFGEGMAFFLLFLCSDKGFLTDYFCFLFFFFEKFSVLLFFFFFSLQFHLVGTLQRIRQKKEKEILRYMVLSLLHKRGEGLKVQCSSGRGGQKKKTNLRKKNPPKKIVGSRILTYLFSRNNHRNFAQFSLRPHQNINTLRGYMGTW